MNYYDSPSNSIGNDESENKVHFILNQLPSGYKYWHDIDVNRYQPDFLLVGPDIGMVVIEVKGWTISQIKKLDYETAHLTFDKKRKSPFKQGFNQAAHIHNKLKDSLKKISFNKQLKFNYIVAFPNISKTDYEKAIDSNNLMGIAQERLSKILFMEDFEKSYSNAEVVNLIKSRLENKIATENVLSHEDILNIASRVDSSIFISEDEGGLVRILDKKQESLVKCLPNENILVRGVAGSGKSIIVMKRAEFLTKKYSRHKKEDEATDNFEEKNILLIVWNISYHAALIEQLKHLEIYNNFKLARFHIWEKEDLNYDYILIDEAQDFTNDQLNTVFQTLKPNGKVFIASDGAQNIYNTNYDYNDFKTYGIEFDDKNIIELNENYRNSREIIEFADYYFEDEFIKLTKTEANTHVDYFLRPANHFQPGKVPEIIECSSFEEEINFIAKRIRELKDRGILENQIAIILTTMDEKFAKVDVESLIRSKLTNVELSFFSKDNDEKRNYSPTKKSIVVSTPQSVKGMEFDHVFVCQFIEFLSPYESTDQRGKNEKIKTFVAITRAIKELVITYSGEKNRHICALERARQEVILNLESLSRRYQYERMGVEIAEHIKFELKNATDQIDIIETEKKQLEKDKKNLKANLEDEEKQNQRNRLENSKLSETVSKLDQKCNSQSKQITQNNLIYEKEKKALTKKAIEIQNELDKQKKRYDRARSKHNIAIVILLVTSMGIVFFEGNIGDLKSIWTDKNINISADVSSSIENKDIILMLQVSKNDNNPELISTYIENISKDTQSFMKAGYYKVGTTIEFYRMDDLDYVGIKGSYKAEKDGEYKEIKITEPIQKDAEISFKLCNNIAKVFDGENYVAIDTEASKNQFIERKESGFWINLSNRNEKK